MHLHTNGLLFAVLIYYVFAVCKSTGIQDSGSERRAFVTDAQDLVSIAKNAVVAARSAVSNLHNAELFVGQQTSASLAKTAEAMEATAKATLLGKQDLLNNIIQQVNEARSVLVSELQQLVQSGRSAIASLTAASQAQNRYLNVASALSEAQETDALTQIALEESKMKYLSQGLMVIQAKVRKNKLLRKLLQAQKELNSTVEAAHQAEAAARIADENVVRSGNETALTPL